MADGKKSMWRLNATVVADAGNSKSTFCGSGARVAIDVMDQGPPICFPMPGMTLRITAARKIGPAAVVAAPRGAALRRSAGPASKGTSKRTR